jgi:hypothetical protein
MGELVKVSKNNIELMNEDININEVPEGYREGVQRLLDMRRPEIHG